MSVLLDVQGAQGSHRDRGIGRYVRELALALGRQAPPGTLRLVANPELPPPDGLASASQDTVDPAGAALWHAASPFEDVPLARLLPGWALLRRLPLVVTLYDLVPLHAADAYLADAAARRRYRTRLELVRRADRVLAISQHTARDAVATLGLDPARVVVVGAAPSPAFRREPPRDEALALARRDLPWLRNGFLLYPGGIDPRKNVDGLLEAYAGLPAAQRREHQLVIVCHVPEHHRPVLEARLDGLGLRGQAVFSGYLPDELLTLLYRAAELVFPSLGEGYGLPVAEALASGAAVVASRNSSLTELVADDDALFDPHDPAAIRSAIERCLADEALLARLRGARLPAGHRWPEVARRTLAAYAAVGHG